MENKDVDLKEEKEDGYMGWFGGAKGEEKYFNYISQKLHR